MRSVCADLAHLRNARYRSGPGTSISGQDSGRQSCTEVVETLPPTTTLGERDVRDANSIRVVERVLIIGSLVEMGAMAIAVEDHDQLSGTVDGRDRVRGHRRKLGSFAGLDYDLTFAES